MRQRLRFTLIFAARISHHSIDNNVKFFTQTQTQAHSVNGPLVSTAYANQSVSSQVPYSLSYSYYETRHGGLIIFAISVIRSIFSLSSSFFQKSRSSQFTHQKENRGLLAQTNKKILC